MMEAVQQLSYIELLLNVAVRFKESILVSEKGDSPDFLQYLLKWGLTLQKNWKLAKDVTFSLKHSFSNLVLKTLQTITCCNFPYQEDKTGTWFTEEIPLPENPSLRQINILNIVRKPRRLNDYPPINETDFLTNLKEDGYQILFHGTNHDSAQNILEQGIRLDKLNGKRGQDFSCGKGFYLTGNYDNGDTGAVNWTFHLHSKKQAVLIFKIPQGEIDKYRENAKNLTNNDDELKQFVEKYRIGDGTPTRKLEKNLKNVSFVEGPWVKVQKGRFISPITESYQICLLNEELAKCFDRHLHSAIFFNRH